MSKVYLISNRSEQFIYEDKTPGIFVGREQERKNLGSIILNNDASTILISSVRGFGKTSFIHKALADAKEKNERVKPIFVNVGHAIKNQDSPKRELLVSLIRASANIFGEDNTIKELYRKTYSKYTEEESEEETKGKSHEIGFKATFKADKEQIFSMMGIIIACFGFAIEITRLKNLLVCIGLLDFGFFLNWKQWRKEIKNNKKQYLIDGSIEYLEIEFENRLKEQNEKKQKIVFVIDELDKIQESESFPIIKEYKNLFTRSFAHFIFIAGDESYDYTNADRQDKNTGTFPTLFTHVFYLQLPSANELEEYLDKIFNKTNDNTNDISPLKKYLLYRSGNDFFSLKKIIGDFLLFDETDKPYLDIDSLKSNDVDYENIRQLYDYTKIFYQKHMKKEKKYWKDNSELQQKIFKFLNGYFGKNISLETVNKEYSTIQEFIDRLIKRAGILLFADNEYKWTYSFRKLTNIDSLADEETNFINTYTKLVEVANNLDELPTKYKNQEFKTHRNIVDNRDGRNLSGINLYTTYTQYEALYKNVNNEKTRIGLPVEDSENANKNISQQVTNVFNNYFVIFKNALAVILNNNSILFSQSPINTRPTDLNGYPNFYNSFVNIPNMWIVKGDNTRKILLLNNFTDFITIQGGLEVFKNDRNNLIINLCTNKSSDRTPTITKKVGRKTIKEKVANFINIGFENDFKKFAPILDEIFAYLT